MRTLENARILSSWGTIEDQGHKGIHYEDVLWPLTRLERVPKRLSSLAIRTLGTTVAVNDAS